MISALLEVLSTCWNYVLEALWRADHNGKSLERKASPKGGAVQQRDEADEARDG
jgi:hypothetical protein